MGVEASAPVEAEMRQDLENPDTPQRAAARARARHARVFGTIDATQKAF